MKKLWLVLAMSLSLASSNVGAAAETTVPEVYRQSYEQETAGYYTAALETLDRLPALGAGGYVLQLRRGWLQYLAGEYDGAVAAYRQAVQLQPDSIEARLGLTAPLMALHKWLDTLDVLADLAGQDPGSYLGRSRRAYCQYQLGRYEQSAAGYRELLSDYPSDVDMRAGLGWALLRAGDVAGANAEFKTVLRVSPDHSSAGAGLKSVTSASVGK